MSTTGKKWTDDDDGEKYKLANKRTCVAMCIFLIQFVGSHYGRLEQQRHCFLVVAKCVISVTRTDIRERQKTAPSPSNRLRQHRHSVFFVERRHQRIALA
jgi:hypothetical protein